MTQHTRSVADRRYRFVLRLEQPALFADQDEDEADDGDECSGRSRVWHLRAAPEGVMENERFLADEDEPTTPTEKMPDSMA